MPGIYGYVGNELEFSRLLRVHFEQRWGKCEFVTGPWGGIGGHSFKGSAVARSSDFVVAVDGQVSMYREGEGRGGAPPPFLHLQGPKLELRALRGNAVVFDTSTNYCILATESSGSFPLYYVSAPGGGLAFSSNLEVLATVFRPSIDQVGTLEYLRNGYTFMGRTYYSQVRRLQPGQRLTFSPKDGRSPHLTEQSRTWSPQADADMQVETAPELEMLWDALVEGVSRELSASTAPSLMLSAGWDSRTLLAAMLVGTGQIDLLAYTHGDPSSRELGLARALARIAEVEFMERALDERIYDLDLLQAGFERVGSVQFPHWHLAGRSLSSAGRDTVFAGVYGEVLGGHYGTAMATSGSSRALVVLKQILGGGVESRVESGALLPMARDLFRRSVRGKPWYLAPSFWASLENVQAAIDADLEDALKRLHGRGIETLESLVEAFISEHRGTQLINMQVLSCRAELDVAMPFTDQRLLALAAQLDLRERVQNKANRRLLSQHGREFLQHPCAATLVPASYPILVQELSRGVRRAWENAWWSLHFRSGGTVGEPRLGWLNLQFLTNSTALEAIAEDLREPIWDHASIKNKVASLRSGEWQRSAHFLVDQLMKVYTVELSLRASRAQ